jgi:hydrogenase maturation factor
MKIWQPWIEETKILITKSAKWVFCALILNLLIMANIGMLVFVVNQIRMLLNESGT